MDDSNALVVFSCRPVDYDQIHQVINRSSGPLGDCYGIDRDENRDALGEVKTEYFDIENGKLVKKERDAVILTGDAAHGHHLLHKQKH